MGKPTPDLGSPRARSIAISRSSKGSSWETASVIGSAFTAHRNCSPGMAPRDHRDRIPMPEPTPCQLCIMLMLMSMPLLVLCCRSFATLVDGSVRNVTPRLIETLSPCHIILHLTT
ncbi:hypothetical protein M3J09_012766 [Ascochyta lentis]